MARHTLLLFLVSAGRTQGGFLPLLPPHYQKTLHAMYRPTVQVLTNGVQVPCTHPRLTALLPASGCPSPPIPSPPTHLHHGDKHAVVGLADSDVPVVLPETLQRYRQRCATRRGTVSSFASAAGATDEELAEVVLDLVDR